jgi:hypothetical protein
MNFFQKIRAFIKAGWHDPVGSKVIAAGIIFVLSTLLITINYFRLITFLGHSSELNNTIIVIGILLLIIFSFSFVLRLIEDIRKKKVAPNIVCVGTDVKPIFYDENKRAWIETQNGVNGAIIKFGNEPLNNNRQNIGELESVNAQIEFYEASHLVHTIDRGHWLDTYGSVWFRFGDRQKLVIALYHKNLFTEDLQGSTKNLEGEVFDIKVRLIAKNNQWSKNFYFDLFADSDGSISIEQIKPF